MPWNHQHERDGQHRADRDGDGLDAGHHGSHDHGNAPCRGAGYSQGDGTRVTLEMRQTASQVQATLVCITIRFGAPSLANDTAMSEHNHVSMGLGQRLRGGGRRALLANAGSMFSATVVTSVLGAAFWWLAARGFTQPAVGFAGAAISAMTLLATFATLGLNTHLMGALPIRRAPAPPLVNAVLVVTFVAGLIFGTAFAFVAGKVSSEFSQIGDLYGIALFSVGVGLMTAGFVLDQALIGLMRGGLQLWRNTVFAVVKLLALGATGVLAARQDGLALYATWVIASIVSIALVAVRAWRISPPGVPLWPQWRRMTGIGRPALLHHALNLALKTPTLLLPVLVVGLVSAGANAAFYIAFMLATFVYMVSISLTTVLYATAATGSPEDVATQFRMTMRISLASALAAIAIVAIAAPLVLAPFGATYAEDAAWSLRILVVAAIPLLVRNHFVAAARIDNRLAATVPLVWAGTALELALATTGALLWGITGLSLGWLCALCLEATLMVPRVRSVAVAGPSR